MFGNEFIWLKFGSLYGKILVTLEWQPSMALISEIIHSVKIIEYFILEILAKILYFNGVTRTIEYS